MDEGVGAAVRRFPAHQREIEALAVRDEEFRSICADLADAENALGHWEASSSPIRDQLCSEYRELAQDLADEVGAALGIVRRDAR